MNIFKQLRVAFGEKLQEHVNATLYTTLKLPFTATFGIEVATRDELVSAVKNAARFHIPILFLGGGSNVAVKVSHFDGLLIRNRYQEKQIVSQSDECVELMISGGYIVNTIVTETTQAGYEGFEYQSGLPGTLGGAICMNSKWMRPPSYCSDTLLRARILDQQGVIRHVDREYFEFAYDYSKLQSSGEIFVDGDFCLKKTNPEILLHRATEARTYRASTQPSGSTSGCYFRNISPEEQAKANLKTSSAGYLIDQAGLKEVRSGGFFVSPVHANFIVNSGTGTTSDLNTLVALIQKKVYETFGVSLVPEVREIGDAGQ